MGRYTGFIAFGLMLAAAAVYSFLPAKAPTDRTVATVSSPAPSAEPSANQSPSPIKPASSVPQGRGFDFYVLALSWSPTFCDSEAAGRNREQCGEDKEFGWVVHGLWPQNDKGWPENCPTSEGSRVPERIGRTVMDIMPSMGLIGHQWRKHGSCSSLSMSDYFKLVRQAYDSIRIPAELSNVDRESRTSPQAVEAAFIRSNPGLARSAVAVTCDRERVDEVRICLDKSLGFRTCPEVDSRSCRRSDIVIPATR
ncbi:ribonuclease T2 family protein [Rhizobium sp. 'Codium 1']|uniref:ribonuclease T2 family protein n=1 Tax=Rhizobium sp. 'Codium 1' TaxID=2940484 RepID=UPI001E35BFEC|nr:ribonuclease T(2) [Rhizobium sp. 'Codium 1']MCC8933760.1 ribonuclease T(2) [Rhizobium sp. 'Codium 1']